MLSFIVFCFLIGSAFVTGQQSICNKYASAFNVTDSTLVGIVVDGTLAAALGSGLHVYFDGEVPVGSTNFTSPAQNETLDQLVLHLTQYFGGALGCSDGSIDPYTGPNMQVVHELIPITSAAFSAFCNALLGVMQSGGLIQADLDTVNATLQTTRSAICNQPDCNSVATTNSVTTNSVTTNSATTGTQLTTSHSVSLANKLLADVVVIVFVFMTLQ